MNVRYRVDLGQIERTELRALLDGGKHVSRMLKRAQSLLAADAGASDEEIARSVGVGGSTVYRTNDASWKVIWSGRRAKSRIPERSANLRARKKPCWWRQPVPAHPRAAPAGRLSCWQARWSSSPSTGA
ncbi:hypothetical protein ABID58_007484 [Bradyrhizobium sp. S3.2.6]